MQNVRQIVVKLIARQALACIAVSVCLAFFGVALMLSLLLGAFIVIIPNVLFAFIFFFRWRERSRASLLLSLYLAEVIKLIFSGALAIFSVKLFPVSLHIGVMLLGMALAYILFWLFAFFSVQERRRAGD
jgi:F0F1-type ATP synthase assembly protein I